MEPHLAYSLARRCYRYYHVHRIVTGRSHRQGQSESFVNTIDRIEQLRVSKKLEIGEVCDLLGISRTMLHYVKKGQRNLSFKALRRLEEAEREAGISEPITHQAKEKPPLRQERKKVIIASVKDALGSIRAALDRLDECLGQLEHDE
jgi:transcriptional regulator with XRE-family HTH domain